VQLSRAWIGEEPVLALGPIGVAPDRQHRGIGSSLVSGSLEEAARRGERAVILLGDPGFYGRLGFAPGSRHGLRNPYAGRTEDGFTIEEEDFQVAVLDEREGSLTGEVRWHPAFG
jgi:putative acetyltransferase